MTTPHRTVPPTTTERYVARLQHDRHNDELWVAVIHTESGKAVRRFGAPTPRTLRKATRYARSLCRARLV